MRIGHRFFPKGIIYNGTSNCGFFIEKILGNF
jgi:hypothetical protein